jgi:hypothetical protein
MATQTNCPHGPEQQNDVKQRLIGNKNGSRHGIPSFADHRKIVVVNDFQYLQITTIGTGHAHVDRANLHDPTNC